MLGLGDYNYSHCLKYWNYTTLSDLSDCTQLPHDWVLVVIFNYSECTRVMTPFQR